MRANLFYLREWERSETKVEEEYCWAMTQAAGRPCYYRVFIVMELRLINSETSETLWDLEVTEYRLNGETSEGNI
jgi:hypothetical protein